MYVEFQQLPAHARVWIYQANRAFTEQENRFVQSYLKQAVQDWNAHGAPLAGSFQIRYNQIIVIAVDEHHHAASGCSIDASTGWFKDLAFQLGIDFFDRSVALVQEEALQLFPLLEVKQAVAQGLITTESFIAIPQVKDLADYRAHWPAQANDSWLKKYFVAASV
ncbi:hypothetical protein EWU23_06565 [Cytophagaceae bacterium 50C-KIRBA]|uniref:ABC transporter ATPase n=1 Tax=Aquirufa beregesia TaxID=2516556 RepID=A0ABX0EVM6_9BACT|nr:hypothetical protein [Aquirufa beregesia]NGZ44131.1 hypothetical protein [Aquirufa beregesia]